MTRRAEFDWTPEKLAELRRVICVEKKGLSAAAKLFGISKGVCQYAVNKRLGVRSEGGRGDLWTVEAVGTLLRLRDEGKSYSQVARVMGISKNAAIGKAQRLGMGEPNARPQQPVTPDLFPPPQHCVFPHGNPGESGFHFCGAKVIGPGEPYCATHHSLCHLNEAKSAASAAGWTEERRIRAALLQRERNEGRRSAA